MVIAVPGFPDRRHDMGHARGLTAIENKGEGIFLQFSEAAIREWMNRPSVQQRGLRLAAGFKEWRKEHPGSSREFPALPF